MSDPFHHKHPYLTVIVLLIILLVISKFFQACSGPESSRSSLQPSVWR